MAQKIFRKYRYDIALDEGIGASLVCWVTGLMVFFMTLALAVSFALATVTDSWATGLAGRLTVELRPPGLDAENFTEGAATPSAEQVKEFAGKVDKVHALLQNHNAVRDSRLLDRAEIRELVEPWLGGGLPRDLPLPALLDVTLKPGADSKALARDIAEAVPEATVNAHTETLAQVRTLVRTAQSFVLMLTGVILLLAVVAISGIVRAKLAIHQQEVETLHLIGASDEYIARQFRRHTLQGTLKGAVLGVACMIAAIFAIGAATGTIDTALMPQLELMPTEWALLAIAPIFAGALIAHITAQSTVMRALSRLT